MSGPDTPSAPINGTIPGGRGWYGASPEQLQRAWAFYLAMSKRQQADVDETNAKLRLILNEMVRQGLPP